MPSPLRFVQRACLPRRRTLVVGIVAGAIVAGATSLLPALAGLLLATKGATWAVATAFVAACLLALRGALRQQLSHLGRTSMLTHIGRVLASRSPLSTASHGADRIESKLFGASYAASKLLAEQAPSLVGNAAALVLILPFVVWLTTWEVAVIALPAVAALGLALLLLRRHLTGKMKGAHEAALAMVDEASSLLRGHLELAASHRLDRQADRMADCAHAYSEALRRSERANAIGGRVPVLVAGSLALFLGWLWLGDRPDLLANGLVKVLVVGSVLPMVSGVVRSITEAQRGFREIATVVELLDVPDAPVSKPEASPLNPNEAVRFHNVSFAYAQPSETSNPLALDSVSFTWRPSEFLALTGPNGTGKSTLVRLLLRLADPKEGAIYVGASDLREGDVQTWRASIAYLPQRPFLPEGFTLRAVIETFGPEVADLALIGALADVGLLPKLEHYHPGDPLAAKVAMLSAGERQRFALARVLADPSPLLILDEPDANLDAAGLEALIEKLPSLAKKRRILLVAHDERLLGRADRVVDLGHPTTIDPCRLGSGALTFQNSISSRGLTCS